MELTYTNHNRVEQGVIQDFTLDLAYGKDENDFEIIGYPGTSADERNSEEKQTITQAEEILSASAVALVRNMPNWKPGSQSGNLVRMKITLPISYRLQ